MHRSVAGHYPYNLFILTIDYSTEEFNHNVVANNSTHNNVCG